MLVCAVVSLPVGVSAGEAPQNKVTTTWLKDPFPNTPPKARDRFVTVELNTPSRTPSVLLDVYDVENDPLTVRSFGKPAHGTAVLNNDGTFTYTPRKDYVGNDEFKFTLSDGRRGKSDATMKITVIRPTGAWSTTSFTDLEEVKSDGQVLNHGNVAIVPRAVDWDGDGKMDLLAGVNGSVWLYRNIGTQVSPKFAAGVKVQAGGKDIQAGNSRMAVSFIDMDKDGQRDLVVVASQDRKVRFYRNVAGERQEPVFAAEAILKNKSGDDCVAEDVRAEIADWNGDGFPDLITGTWSGSVKISYNAGSPPAPAFQPPVEVLDAGDRKVSGSYNLNVRIADINQDGVPDFIDSYNWGTIHFRINKGTPAKPLLPEAGTFGVTGPGHSNISLHGLCDGPVVDFADFNGDSTIDLVAGGERGGKIYLAYGQSGQSYLQSIRALIAAHPNDLATYLNDPANSSAKSRMQSLQGALYDYVANFATPGQKNQVGGGLIALIREFPQYFALQKFDIKQQPGMPSLAVQTWLTALTVRYYDPAVRRLVADAAQLTGGYRKLVEEIGLIYSDNNQNPEGAEAIYQWVRTIPREVYPGTCITAADWMGGGSYLVRGHTKNTFNGYPVDGGEYGFGGDARAVIGDRGTENWFMTVVHHEACHDVDAYVWKSRDLHRRWGQTLVLAGGPDMRADPESGWLSWELTKQHFREAGLWDGAKDTWEAAWKKYWTVEPGKGWRDFGFMRGSIDWFYGAPQESLATQGNQYWNSTEGRIQVALDRWKRGYKSNLTEVLLYMDIWSVGFNKIKFSENDNACNQVISYAQLRRNRHGYIDKIDLGDRYYEFKVDEKGIVTDIVHVPGQ
jgi:hypothetical protein